MYSFSTCWNSHRHTDGRPMLAEIRSLGFEYAELSHGIRLSLVAGILDAVAAGEIKISTVHNFCPLPIGVDKPSPNLYEFSSTNARDRELAIKHTLKTFEFARRLKAELVVLHLGSMELKDYGGKLEDLLEQGQKDSPSYRKLLAEAIARREAKKKIAVTHLYESLKILVPEAEKLGLKLGCENREAVQELPLETDFAGFLRDFPSPAVCYWHDCGHAQIKQNLGFIPRQPACRFPHPRRQVSRHGSLPPGSGDIDYAALKPHVKPDHIKVFELSPKVPAESALRGIAYLKNIWGSE